MTAVACAQQSLTTQASNLHLPITLPSPLTPLLLHCLHAYFKQLPTSHMPAVVSSTLYRNYFYNSLLFIYTELLFYELHLGNMDCCCVRNTYRETPQIQNLQIWNTSGNTNKLLRKLQFTKTHAKWKKMIYLAIITTITQLENKTKSRKIKAKWWQGATHTGAEWVENAALTGERIAILFSAHVNQKILSLLLLAFFR